MGTYVTIELEGDIQESLAHASMTRGFEAMAEIDRYMSYHQRDSDLSRLNRAKPNTWIAMSPLTIEVLKISNELFYASHGVFDIRCGVFLADWGIIPAHTSLRCRDFLIKQAQGVLPVEIDGKRVRKSGPWILDLGGIAKGYAVDHAVKRIKELFPQSRFSGMVNAGGDLRVWGEISSPIAVQVHGASMAWLRSFKIRQTAAATSSVRTSTVAAKAFTASAHVRMPSGVPLKEEKTATAFAPRCCLADALTKVALLADRELAIKCLSSYQARVLIFGSDGHLETVL